MMEFEFPKYNLDVEFDGDDDDTGFPFDDRIIPPPTDRPSSSSSSTNHTPPPTSAPFGTAGSHPRGGAADDSRLRFEDHLRDIAARYPEFAEHIRPDRAAGDRFPRERVRRDPWGRDEFDFGREFDIPREFEGRFPRPREFYPPNTQTYSTSPPFPSESRPPVYPTPPQSVPKPPPQTPAVQPTATATKPASATTAPTQAVGIQQSNTVDLGQVQPPSAQGSSEGSSEGRGQRSMSAPPTDGGTGGKRYVSSIQIPVLQQGGGSPQIVTAGLQGTAQEMGTSNSAPKEAPQPQTAPYRPNEYVIPIHIEGRDEPIIPKQNVPQQYMQQPAAGAQNQPLFNSMKDQFKQQQEQAQREQQQKIHEQQKAQQELETQQQQPQKPQFVKPTPLEMIQLIQRDVSELMSKAEKFAGQPKDKEYIYLDEMLTRNLLKLDNIETEGKDAIRQARREAIKCIEGCISNLEAKANQNAAKEEHLLAIEDNSGGVQKSSSSGSTKAEIDQENALVAKT